MELIYDSLWCSIRLNDESTVITFDVEDTFLNMDNQYVVDCRVIINNVPVGHKRFYGDFQEFVMLCRNHDYNVQFMDSRQKHFVLEREWSRTKVQRYLSRKRAARLIGE